jgi:hypothetical protein
MTSEITKEAVGHTAGPYRYRQDDRVICDISGTPLARCYADRNEDANGPLFATAPHLLKIVSILLGHDDRFQVTIGGNPHATDEILDWARSVYASATGAA